MPDYDYGRVRAELAEDALLRRIRNPEFTGDQHRAYDRAEWNRTFYPRAQPQFDVVQYRPTAPFSSPPYRPDPRSNRPPPGTVTIDAQVIRSEDLPLSQYRRFAENTKRAIRTAYRLARRVNPYLRFIDFLLNAYEIMPDGFVRVKDSYETLGAWRQCSAQSSCGTPPTGVGFYNGSGCPPLSANCLGGQASPAWNPLGTPCPSDLETMVFLTNYASGRTTHVRRFTRDFGTSAQPQPVFHPARTVWMPPAPNPNVARLVNPTPQPLVTPTPTTHPAPDARAVVVTRSFPGGRGPRPPRPTTTRFVHRSRPPGKWEKEKKGESGVRGFGAALARALDGVSEASEIVDALYRALPDEVQERWGCADISRPGDSMGQYGIDAADCKIQALYWNWHRLDVSEAGANILLNELEDRLIGAAAQARNRLTFRGRRRQHYQG